MSVHFPYTDCTTGRIKFLLCDKTSMYSHLKNVEKKEEKLEYSSIKNSKEKTTNSSTI